MTNKKTLLFFLVVSLIFFSPAVVSELLIAHGDGFESYLPLRLLFAENIRNLSLNLWEPNQLLGVPHIGILQSAIFYPLNWLYGLVFIIPFPVLFNLNIIIHYALGAWLMYLLCRDRLRLNIPPSILAGLIWGFGSFNQAHRGHIAIFNTAIWLPLLIYFVHDLFKKPNLKSAIAISFILAIQIFAGFVQVFLYSFVVLLIYALVFFWKSKYKKHLFAFGVLSLVLMFLITAPQFIQTLEYSSLSYRDRTGSDFLIMLSYQPTYLITLILPFVFGGGFNLPLWGYYDQVNHGVYVGLISLVFIPFAIFKIRSNRYVLFSFLLLLVSLLLMLGKYSPIQDLIEKIPLLGNMRIPSRHRYEFSFSLALLAGIGFNYLSLSVNRKKIRKFIVLAITSLGLVVSMIHYFTPQLIDHLNSIRSVERQLIYPEAIFEVASKAFVLPYVFVLAYLFSSVFIFIKKPKMFYLLVLGILLVDLWFFSYKYTTSWPEVADLNNSNRYYESQKLLLSKSNYRYWKVNGFQDNLLNLVKEAPSAGGYDALMNLDYKNLLNIDGRGKSYNLGSLITNNSLLSMLSIKYIYVDPTRDLRYESLEINENFGTSILDESKWISNQPAIEKVFSLQSPPPPSGYDYLTQDVELLPDTAYLFEVDASSTGKQSLYFYIDLNTQGSFNDSLVPNQVFLPEEFMNVRQKYFRIFITEPGTLPIKTQARIISASEGIIKIHGARLLAIGSLNHGISQYIEISRNEHEVILENQNALPRIYSVESLEPYQSMNDFKYLAYTKQPDFGKTAYLPQEEFDKVELKSYGKAIISNEKFENDKINFTSTNEESDSYVVLSDIYYPGWKAMIDGEEVTIHKTNGVLRGIVVPKGEHFVEYKYVPTNFYISLGVSAFTTLSCISYLLYAHKKKKV